MNNHNVRDNVLLGIRVLNLILMLDIYEKKFSLWLGLCGSGAVIGPECFEGNLTGNAYFNILIEQINSRTMSNSRKQNEQDMAVSRWHSLSQNDSSA